MTTRQFNESVNEEIRRFRDAELREARTEKLYQERGYHPDNAQQGEPTSFSQYLERNNDSIDDIGGNVVPDRVHANNDIYKNGNPFQT